MLLLNYLLPCVSFHSYEISSIGDKKRWTRRCVQTSPSLLALWFSAIRERRWIRNTKHNTSFKGFAKRILSSWLWVVLCKRERQTQRETERHRKKDRTDLLFLSHTLIQTTSYAASPRHFPLFSVSCVLQAWCVTWLCLCECSCIFRASSKHLAQVNCEVTAGKCQILCHWRFMQNIRICWIINRGY